MTTTVLLGALDDTLANRSTLDLIHWWSAETAPPQLIALHDGPLRTRFERSCPVWVTNQYGRRRASGALQSVRLHRLAEAARTVELRRRLANGHETVYLAGLGGARILQWLPEGAEVVAHLHDTELAVEELVAEPDDRSALRRRVRGWVAGSDGAAAELTCGLGVDPVDISVIADTVAPARLWPDPAPVDRTGRRARARSVLTDRFGVPADGPLIVGHGPADFNRPDDRFAELAWDLHLRRPGCAHLVWACGGSERMLAPLRAVVQRGGLDRWVHVDDPATPALPSAELALAADVRVFTGRTPRVAADVLEARRVGTVSVGFRTEVQDGGAPDVTVLWPDVPTLAGTVLDLLDAPEARRHPGRAAPGSNTDWDPRVGGPRLLDLLAGHGAVP